eukprot:3223828-Rhodomonas_salina.1
MSPDAGCEEGKSWARSLGGVPGCRAREPCASRWCCCGSRFECTQSCEIRPPLVCKHAAWLCAVDYGLLAPSLDAIAPTPTWPGRLTSLFPGLGAASFASRDPATCGSGRQFISTHSCTHTWRV